MTFIRTKKIKGNKYAYLVKNYATKKGVRQKSKKYLGRVVDFPAVIDADFFLHFGKEYDGKSKTMMQLITDLVEYELVKHGFTLMTDKKTWQKGDCYARLKPLKFFNKQKKQILLGINEGILCKEMIHRIFNIDISKEEDPRKEAYLLAKAFVEAGFKVPKEVFVIIWEKKSGQTG